MPRSLEAKFVLAGDCQSEGSQKDRALELLPENWGWKQDVDLASQ